MPVPVSFQNFTAGLHAKNVNNGCVRKSINI